MIKSHPFLLFRFLDVVQRLVKENDQEEQEGIHLRLQVKERFNLQHQFRLHDSKGLYEIHGQANG